MCVSDFETHSDTGRPRNNTKGSRSGKMKDIVESEFSSCTARESDAGSSYHSKQQRVSSENDQASIPRSSFVSSAANSLYTCAMDDKIVSKILIEDQSYTPGLVQSLNVTKESLALRIWIIDNSGSMQNNDGNRLVVRSKDDYPHEVKMISCKRWEEMKSTVNYHIQLAETIQAPTSFRFLNNPVDDDYNSLPERFDVAMPFIPDEVIHRSNSCTSFYSNDDGNNRNTDHDININNCDDNNTNTNINNDDDVDDDSSDLGGEQRHLSAASALEIMDAVRPRGSTPLTKHILQIHKELQEGNTIDTLRQNNQSIVIVIATDGLPTDKEGYSYAAQHRMFVDALKLLQGLGQLRVIIRLCTEEERVVSFYNDLDSIAGLSVEVLQDFVGQAKGVHEHNPWINYTLPLHRLREMGYHDQILDLLDRRPLTKEELYDFSVLLFGSGANISDTASSKNMNSTLNSDPSDEKEQAYQFCGIDLPNPSNDWVGFMRCLTRLSENEELHWHPIKQRAKPWVSLNKMNAIYGSSIKDYYKVKTSLFLGLAH